MPAQPLAYLEGEFIIPENSGLISEFQLSKEASEQPGFHELRIKKKVGDRIAVPPAGYERAGMIVARGGSHAEAQKNLAAVKAGLSLSIQADR
jgi:hypothetical protein